MIEVRIKNKESNHSLSVKGKNMDFEDGSIFVTEEEAQWIKELNEKRNLKEPEYEIIEPEVIKEELIKKAKQAEEKVKPTPKKKVPEEESEPKEKGKPGPKTKAETKK